MEKQYKRTSKTCPQDVRTKIGNSLRGRSRSEAAKEAISQGLKRYWGNSSNFPDDNFRHEGSGNGYIETGDVV